MGQNLPAKKYKHSNPTVTRLSFELDGGTTKFIDIARALSAINRKFYRQGVYYYVNSVEIYNNETGVVDLHTLPDNWITKNAWNRGFKLWQKMISLTDSPLTNVGRPKFHDFKVFMNVRHMEAATSENPSGSMDPVLHDINGGLNYSHIEADEWTPSEFVSADSDGDTDSNGVVQEADNFLVHMQGNHQGNPDNWQSVGLVKSYAESRAMQAINSPNDNLVNSADPLLNVFDFSSEEQMNDIITNLIEDGDQPPYNYNEYVGEQIDHMQHVARIGTEVGVGRVGRASGFCAPFGLICVDPHGVSTAFRVVLNLAMGTYHGVYAERV